MDQNVKHFLVALQHQGVDIALASLNAQTPCRFTGIFELVGANLRNRHLVDKHHEPRSKYLDVVPFEDSFCQIALREGEFRSTNTTHDSRVDYSPYQGLVVSYHAVPLLDRALTLRGTLCHFDLVETSLDDYQFSLLRQAARILPTFLYGTGPAAQTAGATSRS
jgi:hypothetical protein